MCRHFAAKGMKCFVLRTQSLLLHNSCNCIMVIIVITFMQVFYNYIPESNSVSSVCSAAAVLYVQFVLHAEICYVVLH